MSTRCLRTVVAVFALAAFVTPASAARTPHEQLARSLLEELVEIDTSASAGPQQTRVAAERMAARLIAGGFPREDVRVLVMDGGLGTFIARYRSPRAERDPILLVAHLDVVEALASDWSVEPFRFLERDGYFYGRGVWDNKAGAAMLVASFLRLRAEDEESEQKTIQWLLREHRPLLDGAYALNTDGGRLILRGEQPQALEIDTSEKIYVSYALTARNPGGHSSLPRTDNAIYDLAATLTRLRDYRFPIDLSETTREFLRLWPLPADDPQRPLSAALVDGRLDDAVLERLPEFPYLNAVVRTTCVATQLEGGHAENALPQTARAVVNCRVLPQSSAAEVETRLRELAAPSAVSIEVVYPAVPSPPSPVDSEVFAAAGRLAAEFWPGIPVLPQMATGATDGLYLRNAGIPTYTVDFLAEDPDDDRTHGRDERLRVASFYTALEVWYRLLRELSGSPTPSAATGQP